jgi:hypothetical protein
MVIITLSTAVIFALAVFPALCCIVPLATPDTASISALWSGRFHDFLGLVPPNQARNTGVHGAPDSGRHEDCEHTAGRCRSTQILSFNGVGELLQCTSVPFQSQGSLDVDEPPAGWQGM